MAGFDNPLSTTGEGLILFPAPLLLSLGLIPDMLSLATSCPAPPDRICIPCTPATQQTNVDYTLFNSGAFGKIFDILTESSTMCQINGFSIYHLELQ